MYINLRYMVHISFCLSLKKKKKKGKKDKRSEEQVGLVQIKTVTILLYRMFQLFPVKLR